MQNLVAKLKYLWQSTSLSQKFIAGFTSLLLIAGTTITIASVNQRQETRSNASSTNALTVTCTVNNKAKKTVVSWNPHYCTGKTHCAYQIKLDNGSLTKGPFTTTITTYTLPGDFYTSYNANVFAVDTSTRTVRYIPGVTGSTICALAPTITPTIVPVRKTNFQGSKLILPSKSVAPQISNQTVTLISSSVTSTSPVIKKTDSRNPYLFPNVALYTDHTNVLSVPNLTGYSISYNICFDRTNSCINATTKPGNSVTINNNDVPDGKNVFVNWYYTSTQTSIRHGGIKGFKVLMPKYAQSSVVNSQRVTVIGGGSQLARIENKNPFNFINLDLNNDTIYTVSVPPLSGYTIGYQLCYNSSSCNNKTASISLGNSVDVQADFINNNSYASVNFVYTPVIGGSKSVTISGYKVVMPANAQDEPAKSAPVSLVNPDGTTITDTNEPFTFNNVPLVIDSQHKVRIAHTEDYTVSYRLCINNCTSGNNGDVKNGDTVVINDNDISDQKNIYVRWMFTKKEISVPKSVTISGYKVIMPANSQDEPAKSAQVSLVNPDGKTNSDTNEPYTFNNVLFYANGQHIVKIAHSDQYDISYRYCIQSCTGVEVKNGDTVTISDNDVNDQQTVYIRWLFTKKSIVEPSAPSQPGQPTATTEPTKIVATNTPAGTATPGKFNVNLSMQLQGIGPVPNETNQSCDSTHPCDTGYSCTVGTSTSTDPNTTQPPASCQPNGTPIPSPDLRYNAYPQHVKRAITLYFYPLGGVNPSLDPTGIQAIKITVPDAVTFNPSSGVFASSTPISISNSDLSYSGIQSGQKYSVLVKSDGYLRTVVTPSVQINFDSTIDFTSINNHPTSMLAGDFNGDNSLDLLDYQALISCFPSINDTAVCNSNTQQAINFLDQQWPTDSNKLVSFLLNELTYVTANFIQRPGQ